MVSISKVIGWCNRCGLMMECLRLCVRAGAHVSESVCVFGNLLNVVRIKAHLDTAECQIQCFSNRQHCFTAHCCCQRFLLFINVVGLLLFASSTRYAPSHTLLSTGKNSFETKTIDATDFQFMHENDYERHVCVVCRMRGCVTRTQ